MKPHTPISPPLPVEEYIRLEQQSEYRHEYINGQLTEKPGEKDINNQIAGFIYVFLFTHLTQKAISFT